MTRRTQILLDEERYERLSGRAEERGVSIAELIREGIDHVLDRDEERRERAGKAILATDPIPVDDWPELEREILSARGD